MPNSPIFIDTGYVYALISPRDQWHEKAMEWRRKISGGYTCATVCSSYSEVFTVKRLNDLSRQDYLELLNIGIRMA